MTLPVSRRTLLTAGAGAAAGLSMPAAASAVPSASAPSASASTGGKPVAGGVRFRLDAQTLDGGEQVVSVTLDTSRVGPIDPASLATGTFRVHAKAVSPIPIAPGDQIFSEYDVDRPVTAVRLDEHGDVVLHLSYAEGQLGGGTLGYVVSRGRNVRLDLTYTITQVSPIALRDGRTVMFSRFTQGRLVNPEVDRFAYRTSGSGMKYRLWAAPGHARRDLVVWLHGGGEGGSLPDGYYDNETTLRANRGALGFVTAQAQAIFGGAHVVAPQSTSFWLEDGDRFAPQIREIIGEVTRGLPVDPNRIHVVGASNGGYMTLKMTTIYRHLFASSVPICAVVQGLPPGGGPSTITDAELRAIDTPTWLVASRDDTTVPPGPNTVHAHELIRGSRMSLYDTVTWNGYRFPGHWSWIYVARNDPSVNGEHLWQWMARRRR